jgi:hypothetical protein
MQPISNLSSNIESNLPRGMAEEDEYDADAFEGDGLAQEVRARSCRAAGVLQSRMPSPCPVFNTKNEHEHTN